MIIGMVVVLFLYGDGNQFKYIFAYVASGIVKLQMPGIYMQMHNSTTMFTQSNSD